MKMSMIKYKYLRKWPALLVIVGGVLLFSCNKSVTNLLDNNADYAGDTSNIALKTPKVLYIIVDGARGEAVKDIMPTNLSTIAKNAIYTFNSLDNSSGINAVGWADMLTRVDSAKHQVKSADFSNNQLSEYPSLFTRLKKTGKTIRTAAFVRSQVLNDYLLSDATVHQVLNSDEAVTAAGVNELASNDASVVLVELNNVDSIGQKYSYATADVDYAASINKADTRIGELLTSMRSRANFKNENWLVVVASNKGGVLPYVPGTDTTLYSSPKGNGFIYFYNPRFKLAFSAKPSMVPYIGSTPLYTGGFTAKSPAATVEDFDIKANNEMTISFKLNVLKFDSHNPGIVLKTKSSANSNHGWWFCHNGSNGSIRFVLRGSSGGNKTLVSNSGYQALNEWHSYTGKVYFDAGKRYMRLYVDGLPTSQSPIDVTGLDCTADNGGVIWPISVGLAGGWGGGSTRQMVTDLRIYDTAVSDAFIAETACKRGDEIIDDPYQAHLIGFWPCTDGEGTIGLKDRSGHGNDLVFNDAPGSIWNSFSDLSNNVCPNPNEAYLSQTPKGLDIPYQIYQWLGINTQVSWNLDGRAWPPTFRDMKEN